MRSPVTGIATLIILPGAERRLSGTTPSRTSRHRAIGSLRAKATTMGLASATGALGAGTKPLRQGALLLEHEKSPRQLDHASPNSSVAGTGQPFRRVPLSSGEPVRPA